VRILVVTDTYAPARNGVAMWVALDVRELRARGHEVEVLTYSHDRREAGLPGLHELPAWAGLDRDFKVAPILTGLPASVEGRAFDIVHVHHPILLGPPGVRLGRRCGAKVVFTCHSVYTDYLEEYYWGLGRPFRLRLRRSTARFVDSCDAVLAPSTRVEQWLRSCGATVRIESLEAPADTARLQHLARDVARAELAVGDRPLAFYVGRIADEKHVQDLVHEFAGALDRMPDALLALGGSGRRFTDVRREIARTGLGDNVRLLGPLDARALSRWYSAADVCASASRSETGPLTVVEAMACGCPTVAYRAPGFEDRVSDGVNGLLVEDVPGALGHALASVLTDRDLRARLSAGATARAVHYTPDAVTATLLAVYESLLA
jgi:glycosyltransferase involved in cell wall biosynthesis